MQFKRQRINHERGRNEKCSTFGERENAEGKKKGSTFLLAFMHVHVRSYSGHTQEAFVTIILEFVAVQRLYEQL